MGSTVQTLYRQIEEYYYRRLSFHEDNIKAVTGIINAFELGQDHSEAPPSNGLAAIYVGSNPSWSDIDDEKWDDAVLLVVEKVDDSTWRRIGVLRCSRKRVSHRENTLAWLNRIKREGGWEMRTLCLV
ncbi:unnamed protein product [Alternaria alternata]